MEEAAIRDVVIVGGGLAGLSAALRLGRAFRDTLVIDAARSSLQDESRLNGYVGLPDGLSGDGLLERARDQALAAGADWVEDDVLTLAGTQGDFRLTGEEGAYRARRVVLAVGRHVEWPPIPGLRDCVGRSAFLAGTTDLMRLVGSRVVVLGTGNAAARAALWLVMAAQRVVVATHGEEPRWEAGCEPLLKASGVRIERARIEDLRQAAGRLKRVDWGFGSGWACDALLWAPERHAPNPMIAQLGLAIDPEGAPRRDARGESERPGIYVAGSAASDPLTPLEAAADGARVAHAIDMDLFEESLAAGQILPYRLMRQGLMPARRSRLR